MTKINELLLAMKPKEFELYITNNKRTFDTYRKYYKVLLEGPKSSRNTKKRRYLEKHLKSMIEEGIPTKRRQPGSGTKKTEQVPYKNDPNKTYTKTTYDDPLYVVANKKSFRKPKRKSTLKEGEKPKTNSWIKCTQQAKEELGIVGFLKYCKEVTDPNDPDQVAGNELYRRAKEIMEQKKLEAAKAAEEEQK